jgi:hypothetical protein
MAVGARAEWLWASGGGELHMPDHGLKRLHHLLSRHPITREQQRALVEEARAARAATTRVWNVMAQEASSRARTHLHLSVPKAEALSR